VSTTYSVDVNAHQVRWVSEVVRQLFKKLFKKLSRRIQMDKPSATTHYMLAIYVS